MSFENMTIKEFTDTLATKAPVPGGGGASALVGAIGTALGCMVGSLTVGKKKYAAVEGEIKALMEQASALQGRLMALVDEDARVFEPLARAYSLPRETEEERAHKAQVMALVLREATEVPMGIMECCCQALDLIAGFAEKGSAIAISDAGVAAAMCVSALKGASLNVFINTRSMEDRALAEELNQKANLMLSKYVPMGDEIFAAVLSRLSK